MAAIQLTNPAGGPAAIETSGVVLIFFSPFLAHKSARSSIVLDDGIRSFKQTPEEVAQLVTPSVRLVKLTLPDLGEGRARGPIWIAADLIIDEVVAAQSSGSLVQVRHQKGPIHVVESKADASAAIAAAKATPLVA